MTRQKMAAEEYKAEHQVFVDAVPHPFTALRQLQFIGAALRTARDKKGFTLVDLSVAAGVSYQHICRIENGKENFSFQVLHRICKALDKSVLEIVSTAHDSQSDVQGVIGRVPRTELA